MKHYSAKKLALAGMFCAVAVVGSVFSFPVFGSKCAPVQHMVNILGYVGAGGLGLIMNEKIGWREYDSLGMILIVLFITVMIIEGVSHALRKRLT